MKMQQDDEIAMGKYIETVPPQFRERCTAAFRDGYNTRMRARPDIPGGYFPRDAYAREPIFADNVDEVSAVRKASLAGYDLAGKRADEMQERCA